MPQVEHAPRCWKVSWETRLPAAPSGGSPPGRSRGGPPAAAPSNPCQQRMRAGQEVPPQCEPSAHLQQLLCFAVAGRCEMSSSFMHVHQLSRSPHQLQVAVQASPAGSVGARQGLALWHHWPPALPDRGSNLQQHLHGMTTQGCANGECTCVPYSSSSHIVDNTGTSVANGHAISRGTLP